MILLELFFSFFQVGLFSFGGGYAALPMVSQQVVDHHGWLTMTEFADIVTISQMTPGPIAINAATFVGMKVAGVPGAIVATLGNVLPSIIISLLLAYLYYRFRKGTMVQNVMRYVRPAAVGLIGTAGLSIAAQALWGGGLKDFSLENMAWIALPVMAVGAFLSYKGKVNPVLIILGSGVIGAILYFAGVPL